MRSTASVRARKRGLDHAALEAARKAPPEDRAALGRLARSSRPRSALHGEHLALLDEGAARKLLGMLVDRSEARAGVVTHHGATRSLDEPSLGALGGGAAIGALLAAVVVTSSGAIGTGVACTMTVSTRGAGVAGAWRAAPASPHFDGTTWTTPVASDREMNAICGTGPNDVWMASEGSSLRHWNGKTLEIDPFVVTRPISVMAGSAKGGAWALGQAGVTLHLEDSVTPLTR